MWGSGTPSTRARPMRFIVGVLALGLAAACRTAAPPPPPAPVVVTPAVEGQPAPPEATVRVTAGRLNVRETPSTSAPAVARVKKGERLAVVGRDGDWVQVRLADGRGGWVSGAYVKPDVPCAADKPGAELLSDVPLSFSQGAAIGKVVIEATVDSSGSVTSTRVVTDTTGTPELLQRALSEVSAFKFAPPVRDCRPVPFIYTYTRSF
jgi:TonB family protein